MGPADHDEDLVFVWGTGHPMDRNAARRAFQRLARKVGIDHIRFHDLRHTAATLMLAAGIHPKIVSERLGHATVSIKLDTHSHVLPDLQRDAANAMDAILRTG